MKFDRPFIITRTGFKRNTVASEAIEFLNTANVPSEYHKAHYLLVSFFRKGLPLVSDQFQQLVNLLCYGQGPKSEPKLKNILQEFISEPITHKILITIFPLFNVLVFHLALEKKIYLPPVPVFSGPRAGKICATPWFGKLPSEVRFWCIASNKRLLEKHSESLNPSMVKLASDWYKKNEDHKNFSAAAVLMRHYFAYLRVSSFDVSAFTKTRKLIWALTTNSKNPGAALWLYSELQNQDVLSAYKKGLAETVPTIGAIPQIYQQDIIDRRREAGLSDPCDLSLSASSVGIDHGLKVVVRPEADRSSRRKLPTVVNTEYGNIEYNPNILPKPEGHSVYELKAKRSVRVGDYFLSDTMLSAFRPENIYEAYPKSIWLAHQKDYLDDGKEKSTKKTIASSLRILNAYLFSYLPWFKEHVDPKLQAPERLEQFDPNLFVRNTHSFLLRLDPNTVLPITFPAFHEKCVDVGVKGGKANINHLQSSQNNITRFFDNYIALEGLSINNPMSVALNIRGYSYAEAQKKKVDYDYWWLLRDFLFAFSSCSLRARRDLIGSTVSQESWEQKFLEYAREMDVKLGNVSLDLSSLEGLNRFDPSTIHVVTTFFCLVSQCGIRFSNAFWLDARTFDSNLTGKEKEGSWVEVWVNTDKAKLKPFQTHVDVSVMNLLSMLNDIRGNVFSDDAVFYQNNKESKWGEIVPLFRFSANKHTEDDADYFNEVLADLLYSFQALLKRTGYDFDSYLYPKSHGMTLEDIEIYKATRTQGPIRTFVVDHNEFNDEGDVSEKLRPVSLVKYKSSITVHGLRKTFDSFFSLLVSNDKVGEFWTGQTPNMVGYYSSNTVGEYKMAHQVAEQAGLPFIISKEGKDSSSIVNGLKERGIPAEALMISAVNIDDFDLNEEYKKAPDKEISVNRTHICPYANICPKKIRAILDNQKLCGICPAALSFPGDAPAIAATIRKIGDQMASLSTSINSNDLTKAECDDAREERMRLMAEFSAWMVRHDQLLQMTNGEILLGENGADHYQEKLTYHNPNEEWSEEKRNLWRIIETSDAKTLQSEKLKVTARRYARNMISKIDPALMERIETQLEIDPVKSAALFVEKTARLQGLSIDEVVKSIEDQSKKSGGQSLWKLIGVSDGE